MNNTRINEIQQQLTAFSKQVYTKQEYFYEFNLLQEQMAKMIGIEKGRNGDRPRFGDINYKFHQMVIETKSDLDELQQVFRKQTFVAVDELKAISSGEYGEKLARKSLDTVKRYCKVLRNIEFRNGNHDTEIDFVVLTTSKIFIVEVKNTKKDILIDEQGNYKRLAGHGEYVFDKNIGQQMNEKEYLLREVLKKAGVVDVEIASLVVFTNSGINVTNNFEFIKTCYLSQLPHIIDQETSANEISEEKIAEISNIILKAHFRQPYGTSINIHQLKSTFAKLLAGLEEAQAKRDRRKNCFFAKIFRRIGNAFRCLIG